jgi:hypothetical protein
MSKINQQLRLPGGRLLSYDEYAAVWHPGSGEQFWWTVPGDEFKSVDQEYFNKGLRIVATSGYGWMAVWQPGSGDQHWWSGPAEDFEPIDSDYFGKGYRLVSLGVGFWR